MRLLNVFLRTLRKLSGTLPSHKDAVAQVTKAYRTVLQRAPDAQGLESYAANISSGRQSIHDLFEELLASAEFESQHYLAIDRLYKALLRRQPDAAGLTHQITRLRQGEANLIEMVEGMIASPEFATAFSRQDNVARALARDLLVGVTGRDPGIGAVQAYADTLIAGRSLADLLQELQRSPESHASDSLVGIATLAQELIAAHLAAEGSKVMLAPMSTLNENAVSVMQTASLIRTLAMLGTPATQSTGSGSLSAAAGTTGRDLDMKGPT